MWNAKIFKKSEEYTYLDKYVGRNIKNEEFEEKLSNFFLNEKYFRDSLIKKFINELERLLNVMKIQNDFIFYGSSLLLIYEGSIINLDEIKISVKFIDFANVFDNRKENLKDDSGFIFGISNLIQCLKNIREYK